MFAVAYKRGNLIAKEREDMKKQLRIVVAAVCAFAMVGAFALTGCSSNGGSTEQKNDSAAEQSADNNKEQVELQVFAANSLSKAMEEVQAAYIADGHDNVSFADTQYKASGELNEMLGAGSYADLLISASKGSMDTAVEKGYVDSSTRVDMFKNDLVMVSKEGADIKDVTLDDIAAGKYCICVGDDSVPAGNYAAQSLSTVGVYTPAAADEGKTGKDISGKGGSYQAFVDAGHKVVTDTSVGNVCKHAQSGDVDVAFVYTSDVYRFGGVQIVGTVPANTHKNIVYPGAVTSESKNATTTAAMTHAAGLKMSGKPVSIQNRPNAVFEPHANSRMKPHTVGGNTMGMVKMASKMLFARELRFRQKHAANRPKITMNTMAMPVVRRLTHSGLQSKFCRNSSAAARPVSLATMLTWSAGAITPKSANEGLA